MMFHHLSCMPMAGGSLHVAVCAARTQGPYVPALPFAVLGRSGGAGVGANARGGGA